ncbi:neuromedin-U receptor 2-like [Asbolus verrucosus]|uniref:Neuromedin-U receptor 2-like n=1 Tax=Asbolus verrucosus TaxID=1661398 RepID=A0A482WCP9_ASBVE|nr:neuromedin-U receptor 2-like [Asbolus verrucosus]
MTLRWNESLYEDIINETESLLSTTDSDGLALNSSRDENFTLYPLTLVIPITVVYGVIFITGVIGNVSTCIVISCNKSMHTATNYYLFSLAISDMLLLISGLPPEMYSLWYPQNYVFGEAFCVLQGFAAETSANATVLTITAFTVERYVAICHPFLSHTMSKLSRAVRYIVAIWIVALCLAAPQAIQFGVVYELKGGVQYSRCTVVSNFFQHAFEISTFLFFVGPMTLITVLYVLIGVQLRKSRDIAIPKRASFASSTCTEHGGRGKNPAAQNRVVKMLIAVVAAFFICWAPFHAQRLLAVYLTNAPKEAQKTTITIYIYMILMYVSGILYFLSTTINPILYHIMSNKFREAFKKTLTNMWRSKSNNSTSQTYSVLSKCPPSVRHLQRSVSDGVEHHMHEELKSRSQTSYTFLGSSRVGHNSSTMSNCRAVTPVVLSSQNIALSTLAKTLPRENGPPRAHSASLRQDDTYLESIRHRMFHLFSRPRKHFNNNFFRHHSVDSSHTISNSSLQDVDEIDYSSSDLVRYMEEINEDIA